MIEGELFGYVKGAFTGATNDFRGMIAAAEGSTLFLDEISEMPAELQTRFLRVLQEREFRPLGSTKTLKADFRVVAATNRPVHQALAENRLRSDLYYRLNTFQIELPPLRERKEDIPPLVASFVKRFAHQLGKPRTVDFAGGISEIARIRLAGKRARAPERDGIRRRPRAPGPDHGEGIAGRSAPAACPAKDGACGQLDASARCATWMRWSGTRSSMRSHNVTGTRRKRPSCSASSARRSITK